MTTTSEQHGQRRTKYYKDNPETVARRNRTINAVSRLAYQIAGGSAKFYALSRPLRKKIRETAKQMQAYGQDFVTAERVERVDKRGFVYIITNPAWPAYCKIGRAFDPERRLTDYQTGAPERDYALRFACYFEDCYVTEKYIHSWLADYRAEGEWFRILPSTAESLIYELMEAGYVG